MASVFSQFGADHGFGNVVITWPPSGVALAAVYFWGRRALPGLVLAALSFRFFSTQASFPDSVIYTLAASLQAVLGAYTIRFAEKKWVADRMPHRIATWGIVCYTIGTFFVPIAELLTYKIQLPNDERAYLWLQFWAGEASGALVGASLTSIFLAGNNRTRTNKAFTAILLLAILFANSVVLHFWNLSWRGVIQANLSRRTYEIESVFVRYMNLTFESVRTIAQLAEASKSVEGAEFSKFVSPFFERYPGVHAFEWISRVDPENLATFQQSLRRNPNNPTYVLTTPRFKTERGPDWKPPHYVISFIEPLEGNESAIGYDVTKTPAARENLTTATTTGKFSLSEPITLIQEKGSRQSVVGYFPFYRAGKKPNTPSERNEKLVGLVGGVFRLSELLPLAIGELDLKGIQLRIEDPDSTFDEPLFDTARPGESRTHFSTIRFLQLENQSWRLSTALTVDALQANRTLADIAMPIGGMLITGLMTFIVILLTGRSAEIERLITRRTEQLQKSIVARDDFLLAASHELKTPLTPLRLQVDFLRELAGTKRLTDPSQNDEIQSLLSSIGNEVERYGLLVNDLLDFSRFSTSQLVLRYESCDIGAIAKRAVEAFKTDPRKAGHPIELIVRGDTVGKWDPQRLQQVLVNLISNAVKYGDSKPVRIDIEGGLNTCRILVSDQGIGIAKKDQAKIFDRFERAVEIKNYPGLGLGLFIVQEIVQAHAGTVSVLSAPGMGSTFTVELPKTPS